jgi:nucleoid DNA-binding protein
MSEKYTRADIAKTITEAGIERVNAAGLALAIVKSMADALIAGKAIELRGFGSLEVKARKAATKRNPRTGEAVIVPPRRRVVFHPGQELKAALRGPGGFH